MSSINTNFYQYYQNSNLPNNGASNGNSANAAGSVFTTQSPVYSKFQQFYDNSAPFGNNGFFSQYYGSNFNALNLDINAIYNLYNTYNNYNKFNISNGFNLKSNGRVEDTIDENGNKVHTQYDSNNKKSFATIYDAKGIHLRDNFYSNGILSQYITYDDFGSVKTNTDRTTNSNGTAKETVKDANGNKIQDNELDKDGKLTWSAIYNPDGSKDITSFENGRKFQTNYNKDGKLTKFTAYEADGSRCEQNYDAKGNELQEDSYSKDGKLAKSTVYNQDGTKKETSFDANGQKAQVNSYGKDGKISHYDTYKNGNLDQKIDRINNTDGSAVDTFYDANGNIQKDNYLDKNGNITSTKQVLYRKGDNGYGYIDWNNDGKFGNDTGKNGGYDGFIAVHGDIDNFFTGMGYYFQTPDMEKVLNNVDNTAKDKNSAAGFVSNGTETLHKISDTQFGMNVTAHDMSTSAGFQYNYFVYDKNKDTYTVGLDNNKDGNLTGDEISCIVQNAGNKMSSPLTFDLNGDGVKTSAKSTLFDINGDGKLDTINDVADGTLSIRGGKDGKDLFGDNTDLDGDGKADGFANGFDALKALAAKEGLTNGKDDMKLDAKDIKTLEDKYQFGMKTGGYNSQAKSLADLGITEINLGSTDKVETTNNFDGRNNMLMTQAGATFKVNGQKRDYADVWHTLVA